LVRNPFSEIKVDSFNCVLSALEIAYLERSGLSLSDFLIPQELKNKKLKIPNNQYLQFLKKPCVEWY
jgi:hypothetical protein